VAQHSHVLLAGFLFGLSLIVAIGAQNTFVLRQGIARERILLVVAVCSVSDLALIALGVAGGGALVAGRSSLLAAIRWCGAAFLLGYAALAVRRALGALGAESPAAVGARSLAGVLSTALALTWLNPAVYLDTVVLLGSVANNRPGRQWWFAAGAGVASVLWFFALGYGARALARVLARPRAVAALDGLVAVVMTATAVRVVLAS
jgi:L-lysine exporter family protein LysE/ArgO